MAVKQQVLALLEAARPEYRSGEELAVKLGVTRAAVWKAIKALQAAGYGIEAVTNRGYRLLQDSNALSATGIAALLTGPAAALRLETAQRVTGTNALLRARALAGEPENLVLLAEEQTEGRGRAGRVFYSPAGTGLYFSVLLRPGCTSADTPLLTLAAATAAAEAIGEVTGREPQIKWVNDLLLDGKKVCGILTEGSFSLEDGGVDFAVVGVGIDLAPPTGGYPAPLAETAGALYPAAAALPAGLRNRLAAAFLNRFLPYCQNLAARLFLPGYRQRLAWREQPVLLQRSARAGGQPADSAATPIAIHANGCPACETATLLDINDDGRLLIRRENGSEEALAGGSARIRPATMGD